MNILARNLIDIIPGQRLMLQVSESDTLRRAPNHHSARSRDFHDHGSGERFGVAGGVGGVGVTNVGLGVGGAAGGGRYDPQRPWAARRSIPVLNDPASRSRTSSPGSV